MDLAPTDDQVTILEAVDVLTRGYVAPPLHDTAFAATSAALDAALVEGGFLDVCFDEGLGAATAAMIVERLARLPYTVEAAASALVRPLLGEDLPRPICLVEALRPHRPVRFLRPGASVVILLAEGVTSFTAGEDQVRAEPEALFAYPTGTLLGDPSVASARTHDIAPELLLTRWRVGLAAEAAGLLAAALASTVAYVSDRHQFGRPLATFQALRHRLAEAQVRANGVYWLAMRAAATLDPGDAALAALHAQQSAQSTTYDFHQMLGAMGMTLEHPLHLWTYRLRALISDLGGRGCQALAASDAVWKPERSAPRPATLP